MSERRDGYERRSGERRSAGWLHPSVLTTIGALVLAIAGVIFVLSVVLSPPAEAPYRATGEPYADGLAAYQRANYEAALAQWTKGANAGEKRSMKGLGDLYRLGQGVPADPGLAMEWYGKAAGQGVPEAQFELAKLIDARAGNTERVLMDQALYWFKNAALQYVVEAQYIVATFHERGRGIRVDLVEAAAWYGFAGSQGHPQGAAERARLVAGLTEQQRVFVEQRERELVANVGRGR